MPATATAFDFLKATHLPNGAEILRRKSNDGTRVVLANFGGYMPFVTWRIDEEGNAFWGHYFFDQDKAEADFTSR